MRFTNAPATLFNRQFLAHVCLALITAVIISATTQVDAAAPLDPPGADGAEKPARPPIYDESADAQTQIAEALARAKKENRRVLIQWGANWCGWCHLLHNLCESDEDIARKLLYEYDVVLIDIGEWNKNMNLALNYKADLRGTGVPYLTILDASTGEPIANQETGSLEQKGAKKPGHDPAKVLEFLTNNQAAPLSANSVFSDALVVAKEKDKRLFLHFGAPWCGWCHTLENWMAQPDIAETLSKEFVDVKIDTDRMTGGKELYSKYSGEKQSGIPWMIFIDPESQKTINCESESGNIGYPVAEREIAHFKKMLTEGNKHLSEADIDRLITSLTRAGEEIMARQKAQAR